MKYISLFLITTIVFAYTNTFGQTDCKVLVPRIADSYEGKCKKGLAQGKGKASGIDTYIGSFRNGLPHGEGMYKWENGAVYEGDWRNGNRDGEGIFTYIEAGEKKVMEGLWKEDLYVGPIPKEPEVKRSTSIFRHQFQQLSVEGNSVTINFYLGGSNNTDLEDLTIIVNNGSQFQSGAATGFDNIIFPFECKINYYTWNQAHTNRYFASIEFVIPEPARWQLNIYNK